MKRDINLLLILALLTSCNSSEYITDPGSYDEKETYVVGAKIETKNGDKVLPFNTMMNLTTYSKKVYEKLTPLYDEEITRMHILFDRYNEFVDKNNNDINNLKIINDSYGTNEEIIIDQDLFNLLEMSIELSKLTEGYFNPTMGYLIDGWNDYFSPYGLENEEFSIQIEQEIVNRKNAIVSYDKLDEVIVLNKEKSSVIFKKNPDSDLPCIISLGGIAKGYAIEKMREEFSKHDTPLLISGSASSSYIQGINPSLERDNWNIQINSPYKNEIFMSLPLLLSEISGNKVVSTSGDYEQSFYYKNEGETIRRHHILNPYSGHSESYYRSISIYSDTRSDILDGLSTALFNINNLEKIIEIVNNVENYYNIEIDCLFQKEVGEKTLDLYFDYDFEKTINKYYDYVQINNKVRIEG